MIAWLPTINATLNGLAGVLLFVGWLFIRRRNVAAHKACMISAFAVSAAFLACYLVYHYIEGSKQFPNVPFWRPAYLAMLLSHIVLAVVMLPMIYVTFYRAFRGEFVKHARIARWTWAIWMYVSVTGVLIYLMLYHWFATAA